MGKVRILFSAAAMLICVSMQAGIFGTDSVYHYKVEASAQISSGDHAPFWLSANRFGLSSIERSAGYLRAGIFKDMTYDKRWSWDAGVDLATAYNFTSSFVVQQLYAGVRYRSLQLEAGSKEYHSWVVDDHLSSGDMTHSINARPIPQVRLSMPDWQYVPLTKKKLAVRGYISYGAFTDQDWQYDFTRGKSLRTKHVLYHSKGGFIRWGNTESFPLLIEGGLEMAAQFGGKIYYPGKKPLWMPHGFTSFIKAFIPLASNATEEEFQGEVTNVEGNQLGQWSLAATWAPKNADWSVRAYYLHFFEDHSMMFFDYTWRDMLLGFEVKLPKNPVVKKVVYEYLNTKDQAGPAYWDHTPELPEQISGRDDYYNNGIYAAWQHWGQGIGNPLIVAPLYNNPHIINFNHTRIKGHHIAMEGQPIPEVDYRLLLTFTSSWGTYGAPTPYIMRNFNAMLEVGYSPKRLQGWNGRLTLGADGGQLLGKSFGAMLTISKSGWL